MKYTLYLTVILLSFQSIAQESEENNEINLEMLQAPSSPAANLLGISDADIQKPSDKNELVALIRQSSDNFSALPTSFALDYSPFRKNLNDFMNYNPKTGQYLKNVNATSNIRQSLVFSLATQSLDSTKDDVLENSQQFAFGFKISLARGSLKSEFAENIQAMRLLKMAMIDGLDSLIEADKMKEDGLLKEKIRLEMSKPNRDQELITSLNKKRAALDSTIAAKYESFDITEEFKDIKKLAEGLSYDRIGFKWDVAAGLVLDFPQSNFDDGSLTKAGIWTVFGYEKSGVSLLGLIRYMHNPNKIYADENNPNIFKENVSTFDLGARFIVGNFNKLSASMEAIHRSASVSEIEGSWRFTLNSSYDVSKNQKLTFIFGRDFDGTISKDGNVIAALSYVRGFGSKLQ